MNNSFQFLVDNARAARDTAALAKETAYGLVRDCQATLNQLTNYRAEYLANAPTSRSEAVTANVLAQFHGFVARLEDAIHVQQTELSKRMAFAASASQRLIAHQKRLLSMEALVARQNAARRAKAALQEQRASDEFAARVGFRMTAGDAA